MSSNDSIKIRRIAPQNIVRKLWKREMEHLTGASAYSRCRTFYNNVFPSHTIVDVDHPPCYLRKFTPDGRRLIAFSIDQTSVQMYAYRGAAAANDLLCDIKSELTPPGGHGDNESVRSKLFFRLFSHIHSVCVSKEGECLNRECSLFTKDGVHLIVSSASFHLEEVRRLNMSFLEIHRNNESLAPDKINLENYTIHIINMDTGKVTDRLVCRSLLSYHLSKQFQLDKIYLSHNQGIYLYENILALFSVQHQTIHIFKLSKKGKLTKMMSLGYLCSANEKIDADELSQWSKNGITSDDNNVEQDALGIEEAFFDNMLTTLKHRLLAYLYRLAHLNYVKTGDNSKILNFHRMYDKIRELRIWRMQLLDDSTILLKYSTEDVAIQFHNDPNSKISLFMIFDFVSIADSIQSKVIQIYENTNDKFLRIFEDHCESFRNTSLTLEGSRHPHLSQYTCSPSNNYIAKDANERFKKSIISAKHGGEVEAIKRLLSQVPISSQSYCLSPYLDLSLFSYDEKWVSVLERPKTCSDAPIRFFQRDSGMLRFRMYAGPIIRSTITSRRLVAFTFHPSDPFTISVQRTNSDYIVNFHLRIDPGLYNNNQ